MNNDDGETKTHWDIHAKPRKATTRQTRGARLQKAYRNWFRNRVYQPYRIKEAMDALNATKEQIQQCIINDRNLFRTWLNGQPNKSYRIGMALLDVQDFVIRKEDYEKLLKNFEHEWMTQPVYHDRYIGMYHVPGFAWKEKNDDKISSRQLISFQTKVFEAAGCGEHITNVPMPTLMKETKRFINLLTGTDFSEN